MSLLFDKICFEGEGKTCKTCKHRQPTQCGGRMIQYCRAIKSNRTWNKLKKIKCKDVACMKYFEQGETK